MSRRVPRRRLLPGQSEGSIIIVIATDAPLDGRQLTRLAKRAALVWPAPARRHDTAVATSFGFFNSQVIPHYPERTNLQLTHLADTYLNPILAATVEATEEAILNALTMATTVTGRDNHRMEAIDLDRLKKLMSGSR